MTAFCRTPFFLGAVLFTLTGCGGTDHYLYYTPPATEGQRFDSVQKIKDLVGNPESDILMIVDNSGSMGPYQKSVAANTSVFVDTLTKGTKLHWKFGLISTSVNENPYLGFEAGTEVTYTDSQAAAKINGAISKLGTGGDSTERTYEPVLKALQDYPQFLRPLANLVLILVSDAPEQSAMDSDEFVKALTLIKGQSSKVYFYGVLDPEEWCKSTDDVFSWSGSKFENLLKLVKGAAYPICDSDYGKNLTSIAQAVVQAAYSPRLPLSKRPKIETLQVLFHGQPLAGGPKENGGYWYYSFKDNSIAFYDLNFAPGELEEVRVTYQEDVDSP